MQPIEHFIEITTRSGFKKVLRKTVEVIGHISSPDHTVFPKGLSAV